MEKKECPNCHGTGRCSHCRGTGALGYPGFGDIKNYTLVCNFCSRSGVCRRCGGRGRTNSNSIGKVAILALADILA